MVIVTRDIEHAIKWLAAEYHYLEQLHSDLEQMGNLDSVSQEKKLAQDMRVLNYIGNAQRVVHKDLKRIRKELEQEGKSDVEMEELLAQMEVPAAQLLTKGAKYAGVLRERLDKIRAMMQAKRGQGGYKNAIEHEIKVQELDVENLEKWIAMLDLVLKKIPAQEKKMSRRDFLKMAVVAGAGVAAVGLERKTKAFHRGSGLFDKHIFGSNEIYRLSGKGVYLTIDDGPASMELGNYNYFGDRKEYLEKLISLLWQKQYIAIFFWVGKNLEAALRDSEFRALLIECVRKGFIVGNHSYTHRAFSRLSVQEIFQEIDKTDERIDWLYKEAGVKRQNKLLRFPYGDRPMFFERSEVYRGIKERGYKIMFWSKDTLDWKKESTVESVLKHITPLHSGDIILIHELPRTIEKFVEPICENVVAKGLTFENLKRVV
jgi:peptidoglycan/xylan/chitin deacetylase (PgdA/CDA1 family)